MADNPACKTFHPLLSPFVDGELTPSERTTVERHLAHCASCAARVADTRAEAGLVRLGMEMLADEADFTGFAQKVMARVTPYRPPLTERLSLWWNETWTYQRGRLLSGAAVAAALVLVVPLALQSQNPFSTLPQHLAIRSIHVDPGAHVEPVVMTDDKTGDAIIWLVDRDEHAQESPHDSAKDELPPDENGHRPPGVLPRERPSGGDL